EGSRSIQISTADRLAIKGWWFNEPDQLKTQGYNSVALRATDVSQSKVIVDRLRKEKWNVQSIDAILDVANRIFSVITVMLALASSIALMVASIGIVNTMIMSIYERTREIGTLKAMGASRSDIRHLFMIEAGLIGLLGGAMGLIFSWLLGRGLNKIAEFYANSRSMPMPENLFIITPMLTLQALAFALFIGVVAGLYPANRAAGLDPLKALRHE
ncbi:ABC transporter permease, partial [bacterium]